MTQRISDAGLALIKRFEGLRLDAYRDAAGVVTIGYGTTRLPSGPVQLGVRITEREAEQYLAEDVRYFEQRVRDLVRVPLTQAQFDALVSFAYNVGDQALGQSTLLRKLNAGDTAGAADELLRWNKAGDQVLPGLTRRRAEERALFLSQPAPAEPAAAPPAAEPEIQFPGLEGGLPPPPPRSRAAQMPIPAIVSAAAGALLPLVSDMMRARGSKTAERNASVIDAAAPVLIEIAKQVAPVATNEQEAAEAILADKKLQEQFRAQVALRWSDVAPAFEHDAAQRKAARDFMLEATGSGPAWRQMGAGFVVAAITLAIIIGGGLMFYELLGSDTLDSGQKGMVLGALLAAFASAVQYWLGTTASSRVKDQTISEQARR